MEKNIYLIGFMASGKTLYGKKLARAINYEFLDLDQLIEQKEGKSINRIFAENGESYFRELERLVLKDSFKLKKKVIALGGGTPCFFDNMQQIKNHGISVYLQVSNGILASRLFEHGENRPLVAGKSKEELIRYVSQMMEKRKNFYEQANVSCDATSINANTLKQVVSPLL